MNQQQQNLIKNLLEKAQKALDLVISDAAKLPMLSLEVISDSNAMVPYEALASRFGRAVEVVSNKLFRTIELAETQENQEFIRDRLLKMEKIALISSAELWMDMRNVRNRIVHDYLPEQIEAIYHDILGPFVVELKTTQQALKQYEKRIHATQ